MTSRALLWLFACSSAVVDIGRDCGAPTVVEPVHLKGRIVLRADGVGRARPGKSFLICVFACFGGSEARWPVAKERVEDGVDFLIPLKLNGKDYATSAQPTRVSLQLAETCGSPAVFERDGRVADGVIDVGELSVEPARQVELRCVDDAGRVLKGAEIELVGESLIPTSGLGFSWRADAQGRARMTVRLPLNIVAKAPNRTSRHVEITADVLTPDGRFDVVLPPGFTATVRLLPNYDGSDLTLCVGEGNSGEFRLGRTASNFKNGSASCNLDRVGLVDVHCGVADALGLFADRMVTLRHPASGPGIDVSFPVPRMRELNGSVLAPDGTPAADVGVEATRPDAAPYDFGAGIRTRTDSQGKFVLRGIGREEVIVTACDRRKGERARSFAARRVRFADADEVVLRLREPATRTIRVETPDGRMADPRIHEMLDHEGLPTYFDYGRPNPLPLMVVGDPAFVDISFGFRDPVRRLKVVSPASADSIVCRADDLALMQVVVVVPPEVLCAREGLFATIDRSPAAATPSRIPNPEWPGSWSDMAVLQTGPEPACDQLASDVFAVDGPFRIEILNGGELVARRMIDPSSPEWRARVVRFDLR